MDQMKTVHLLDFSIGLIVLHFLVLLDDEVNKFSCALRCTISMLHRIHTISRKAFDKQPTLHTPDGYYSLKYPMFCDSNSSHSIVEPFSFECKLVLQ